MSDFIWVEKYRPKTIDDCILPQSIKSTFKDFVKSGEIPNMLLSGPPGIGKTTVAKALCHELGVDYYVINGSDEGRFLDTVRTNAKNFASTVSLSSDAKHKIIIIDEADNTGNDVQLLLRAFIEEFANNCRFIFTCNYKNKILEPLHSRCAVVDFSINGKEKDEIMLLFFKRLKSILDKEGIENEPKVLAKLIKSYQSPSEIILTSRRNIFFSLCKSIIGQQISVAAANAVFLKFKKKCNNKINPKIVSKLTTLQLKSCGLSRQKVSGIKNLAKKTLNKSFNPKLIKNMSDEEAILYLSQLKQIGRWSAEMILLFTYNRPNIWPIQDLSLIHI